MPTIHTLMAGLERLQHHYERWADQPEAGAVVARSNAKAKACRKALSILRPHWPKDNV